MAASETAMNIIDPLNMAGLVLIGLGLFLGVFIRLSAISGVFLLLLYYFAYPPFGGDIFGGAEGSLYICLLYTSDAADERSSVDLGGRRIIKNTKSCELSGDLIHRIDDVRSSITR